jgi:sulfur-oxidizing protein SoxZ
MGDSIRIRTEHHAGWTTVRSIIRHPMETGFRVDPETGQVVPAHYITEVRCRHGVDVVLRCEWSRAVSKNPYLSFEFSGARPGDPMTLDWTDNHGASDSSTVSIG